MNTINIILAILAGGAVYYFSRRGRKLRLDLGKIANAVSGDILTDVIDGELQFTDIVAWFRQLYLDKKRHVPFIANGNAEEFKKINLDSDSAKANLFIGVYDQITDEIIHAKFIQAESWDNTTKNTLGDEKLVILQ